jgi:IclR family pca regulon transcriptional regulator
MTTEASVTVHRRDLVEGLAKGLKVIESFDDEHPRLTASQCAERCGITRMAARRHLLTLVHLGYAETDGKNYWLAPRVVRLGQSYLEAARLPRLSQPFLQQLSAVTGETVNLSVLDGHEVLYLGRSNSPRVVSVGFQRGARAPAHTVAPGVVLVAKMGEAESNAWIAEHEFTRFTARTTTSREQFLANVQAARAAGYWIMDQQLDLGFTGVATTLTDRRGKVHGAIGMTLPVSVWSPAAIEAKLLPQLMATATSLRTVI